MGFLDFFKKEKPTRRDFMKAAAVSLGTFTFIPTKVNREQHEPLRYNKSIKEKQFYRKELEKVDKTTAVKMTNNIPIEKAQQKPKTAEISIKTNLKETTDVKEESYAVTIKSQNKSKKTHRVQLTTVIPNG